VYPTLPTTGGGSLVLNIKNEPQNIKIIDYALSNMDVRTTRSRLLGNMTFGVGGPVLIVKDLDLRAAPVNFDLIRTLNGKPFPYDWQGDLTGTVKARGGPVNRFRVDDAVVTFNDAHVPGAVTKATARGELDILFPAFTTFRGFDVDASQLDLRTIQFLNPNFPRLNGIVAGHATLDSVWLDVRFKDADLTHTDGPGEPTRATGSGRVTIGDKFTSYDLALNTQPLSFTTLAHAYQEVALPLRGSYQGPLRVQGTLDDLSVTTDLAGPGGRLTYDGRVDGYPVNYSARGTLTFANLDVRSLFGNDTLPFTSLNGRVEMDVSADSAAVDSTLTSLAGVVSATIDRSVVDSMRVYGAIARLGFNGGRAQIDTIRVETVAGVLAARGALGLTNRVNDSLAYQVRVDSLGGMRRYFWTPAAAAAGAPAANDSIDGSITVKGWARGSIDSLIATGDVTAEQIYVRGDHADSLVGGFEVQRVNRELSGRVSARARNAVISNVGINSGTLSFVAPNRTSGEFRVEAASATGPELLVHGAGTLSGDTTFVRLDTVALGVRDHRLMLERPANIVVRPDGVVMDTIRVRDANQGVVTVVGSVPVEASISLAIRADSVELGDIGELIQANAPFGGLATLRLDVAGVRKDPRINFDGSLEQPRFGDVRLDRATFGGTYGSKRMESRADLFRQGRSILSFAASIPVDLALEPVAQRMLAESLTGKIRSDSVDLAILETISPLVVNASGTFAANLDIGGVWPNPTLNGNVAVAGGALGLTPMGGVRLSDINANLDFLGDSVHIQRFQVVTREERAGNLSLGGWISVANRDDPRFDLTLGARDFHIIERPRVAHLDVSAQNLRLLGSYNRSSLTGLVTVDRGTIYIPELIDKQVISLDSPDVYSIIDTSLTTNRTLLPKAPPALVRNLLVDNVQVRMGNDVWLRSSEANINLGGSVAVKVGHSQSAERPFDQLALDGTLTTNRGTYRLSLGIIQRSFVVDNGTVQFFGDPDFNPQLNINATHTVHRASSGGIGEQDIRIRVNIGGTLAQPRLALSSADSLLNISQTDLVSYLLTGAPSFNVGTDAATLSLLRSVGSYFGDLLRSGIGGYVDVIDIELGRQNLGLGQRNGLNRVFAGARLTTGWQVGNRTFVSTSAGLCQVQALLAGGSGTADFNQNLQNVLGARVDYRLNENVGMSAAYEPSTNALLCNAGISGRGFAPTPRQWGFDIFRTFRF
jgi:translocation and assembly module TamB